MNAGPVDAEHEVVTTIEPTTPGTTARTTAQTTTASTRAAPTSGDGRRRDDGSTRTSWWLRVVGAFYLVVFVVVVFVKAPIDAEGPPGVLARAAAGDSLARFVVDTWTTFGLYLGAVGVGLLLASRAARSSRTFGAVAPVIRLVIALELAGIVADINKLARGYSPSTPVTWMVIHSLVIATGAWVLTARSARK